MKQVYRSLMLCIVLAVGSSCACAQGKLPRLAVSKDHRYLISEQGRPFFWLGDTGWELFHKLNKEEVTHYFATRARQGFTIIQAVALAELNGLRTPNAYGQLPLLNENPLTPNEAYFKYVEWVIDEADKHGLYIALLPTWGDKLFKDKWGEGPEIFNDDNARQYGKWIAARFKSRNNIVWVMGGDRNPRNESDVDVWRAMASGIEEGSGGSFKALITFHPQPSETSSSSTWFHHDTWLDFNMLQTGHCRDIKVWDKVQGDYTHKPAKPVVNGEPIYEEHPVCFNARELGYTNGYDVRKAAYLSVFAGALGVTYGCHAVWQFYRPPAPGINGPLRSWKESLSLEGANEIGFLKMLLNSFKDRDFVPDQQLLQDQSDSATRLQALKGKNYVLVYSSGGLPVNLKTDQVPFRKLITAAWFDPRTGQYQPLSNQLSQTYECPENDRDWVLVLKGN